MDALEREKWILKVAVMRKFLPYEYRTIIADIYTEYKSKEGRVRLANIRDLRTVDVDVIEMYEILSSHYEQYLKTVRSELQKKKMRSKPKLEETAA